ncbi:Ribosomal protein S18 acetylase RimI [Bhargavaea beijingensis]|uniref:Ribosomal protein S18 acetylase RimI n=1 Tax=Bhargavaea beijingensis TaxID=426756 RepID=A0A1G6ZB71_9BACL|nr:GNAT family N-acetyltransferase [Bhargavaea beijingensis]SDD99115.1 Ribosomal protein S18 acetylase RimI [Bhargavaea beijingensis]
MESPYKIQKLDWDTSFFGISCAKVILSEPVQKSDWKQIKHEINNYDFVSIVNENSEPLNAQYIGQETNAFLSDVNIQFEKKTAFEQPSKESNSIVISSMMEENDEILKLSDFGFSKFVEDPGLRSRGGDQVYYEWLRNAFNRQDKFFAVDYDEKKSVNGYLLYSINNRKCVIELIAVSRDKGAKGVGTRLFKALENWLLNKGIEVIKVGTQLRNIGAINFYQKMGCKQVASHQIYHNWNINP